MSDDAASLAGFGGTARLFPLPNLVLFPHVIQPLHVFEQRYRQMTADALEGDRLIAMALLRPGWEEDYEQSPPIHPVVCLGKIMEEESLLDGRYNLMLRGLSRASIEEEIPSGRLYRTAKVRLLEDVPVASAVTDHLLRQQLDECLRAWFTGQPTALGQTRRLMASELGLGNLCDIFAFALPLEPALKQRLLEETDVERRVRRLVAHLEVSRPETPPLPPRPKFPLGFSSN
jgi:Lon protease-like protein